MLTDYRERSLKDVITQLEPGLFKKVTGLDVTDFNLLCSIGVFNASLMNDTIFKFKRYEDASLSYTGIEKTPTEEVSGFDTVIRRAEYEKLFFNQQASMKVEPQSESAVVIGDSVENEDSAETAVISKNRGSVDGGIIATDKVSNGNIKSYTAKNTVENERRVEDSRNKEEFYSRLCVGVKVSHKKFGNGVITSVDKYKTYVKIQFDGGEKMFTVNAFVGGLVKFV